MGQGCRLFKGCRNLPSGQVRGAELDTVLFLFKDVSGISWAQWGRGVGCLSGVRTYLPGTVGQGCRLFSSVRTYLSGTVGKGCRLFKRC